VSSPSIYQGGNYGELQTESITGFVTSSGAAVGERTGAGYAVATAGYDPAEMSGSLSGHILSRGFEQSRRRERRRRVRTALWVSFGLLLFAIAIVVIVDILAGDFIKSIFKTFADFAG
jgi:hypothetical protein